MGACMSAKGTALPSSTDTFDDLRLEGGCTIPKTEERAITLCQLQIVWAHIKRRCKHEQWTKGEGHLVTLDEVNLYDTCKYVIKPATMQRNCSLVEILASGAQPPNWFVSHWWGEAVMLSLRCLEQHAFDHGLEKDTTYWVCAYANNQNDLSSDVTADPSDSSFVKAIDLAGNHILSVLDRHGETYKRVWCCLEIFLGLGPKATYEMYTAKEGCKAYNHLHWDAAKAEAEGSSGLVSASSDQIFKQLPLVDDRQAVGLTNGPLGKADDVSTGVDLGKPTLQTFRQASFPLTLVDLAFSIRVQDASASLVDDKKCILNYICGKRGADLNLDPPDACASYDQTNAMLHGVFAAAGLRSMLEAHRDIDECCARLAPSRLRKFALGLRDCEAFTDKAAHLLAEHLPPTLEHVEITQMASTAATVEGTRQILDSIVRPIHLPVLRIVNLYMNSLTGSIPEAFGLCAGLEVLMLHRNRFEGFIPDLGRCLQLKELWLYDNQLIGPIPDGLCKCTALEVFKVDPRLLLAVGPVTIQ